MNRWIDLKDETPAVTKNLRTAVIARMETEDGRVIATELNYQMNRKGDCYFNIQDASPIPTVLNKSEDDSSWVTHWQPMPSTALDDETVNVIVSVKHLNQINLYSEAFIDRQKAIKVVEGWIAKADDLEIVKEAGEDSWDLNGIAGKISIMNLKVQG